MSIQLDSWEVDYHKEGVSVDILIDFLSTMKTFKEWNSLQLTDTHLTSAAVRKKRKSTNFKQ